MPPLNSLVLLIKNIDYSKTLNYFYIFSDDKDDPESKKVLDTLENIDDECDK